MMTLRKQKIEILSRLIEDQYITLKEALLLLNDEVDDELFTYSTDHSNSWCTSDSSTWNGSVTYAESDQTLTN